MIFSFLTSLSIIANWICATNIENGKKYKTIAVCSTSILAVIFTCIYMSNIDIKPIDVYRGKTTLKITEKTVDGVVVERDSVVIFKNNEL